MRYLKNIASVLIFIVLGTLPEGCIQRTAKEQTTIPETLVVQTPSSNKETIRDSKTITEDNLALLLEEGKKAYDASNYSTALEKWQTGLKQARTLGDKLYITGFLMGIGQVYEDREQYKEALESYKQVLAIAQDLRDPWIERVILLQIGIVCREVGQYQQALTYHEQALAIHREIGNRFGEGSSLTHTGVVHANVGQYQMALGAYEQALAIYRGLGDHHKEGNVLNNIGGVYAYRGQYEQALKHFEQALTIYRDLGDRKGEGGTLNNLGVMYADIGQYQWALDSYEQALAIHHGLGDRHGIGVILNNIGGMYQKLGQYQEAVEHYEQALAIHKKIGDRSSEGVALVGIGIVYVNLGQCQQAEESYKKALAIYRQIGDLRGEGIALNNIGNVCVDVDQEDLYEQALERYRKIGYRRGEGETLTNLGNVYENLGQYQEAYSAFQESVHILETLDIGYLWKAQCGLASVEVKLNQFESAIAYYENALDTIEALRIGLKETEHELPFMHNKFYVYDELIDLLQNLHKKHPDKGYDRRALDIFERKQARVFLEEMGKSGARLFAGIPETLLQRESDLELQVEHTRKQLGDERAKIITEQNKAHLQSLEERENTLKTEQEELKKQMEKDYPDYYVLRYPTPITLKDLQEHVLQPDELLLVYHVLQDKTCLWVIGQERFELYALDLTEDALKEKVAAFWDVLDEEYQERSTARSTLLPIPPRIDHQQGSSEQERVSFVQLSHELYRLLIPDPVRPLLTAPHRLHIVLTGPLYRLPFEALVTALPENPPLSASAGGTPPRTNAGEVHYVIEDIPISYLSSASLLKVLREAQDRRTAPARYPFLAFAHPIYDSQKAKIPPDTPAKKGSGTPIQTLRSQTCHDFVRGDFSEMPETAEEAQAIAGLLNAPQESEPLQLRENASRTKVFELNNAERLTDYQYVLFATHGVLPGVVSYIDQSALVLSYPQHNGYLTMTDVFQLQFNAKLVSLSACHTGRGKQVTGEGIMGLTRAFMYAGTPRVAVTLWSVESHSVKDLDIGFFRYLNRGLPPAKALQAIKQDMLNGEGGDLYRHPYYWAPFVLFGDGSDQ